jgi:type IV pilus assembly protein PilB
VEEAPADTSPDPIDSLPPESVPENDRMDTEPPDSGPVIEAHEIEMPLPRGRVATPMVTLTMLDGTQLRLPALREEAFGDPDGKAQLTARDLVVALRAAAQGSDISEVLDEKLNWRELFAALLSVLMKKHLVADWEFIAELKRKK